MKLSLKSIEALIRCLKKENPQMSSPDENVSSGELRGLSANLREEKERDAEVEEINSEIRELTAAFTKPGEVGCLENTVQEIPGVRGL